MYNTVASEPIKVLVIDDNEEHMIINGRFSQ